MVDFRWEWRDDAWRRAVAVIIIVSECCRFSAETNGELKDIGGLLREVRWGGFWYASADTVVAPIYIYARLTDVTKFRVMSNNCSCKKYALCWTGERGVFHPYSYFGQWSASVPLLLLLAVFYLVHNVACVIIFHSYFHSNCPSELACFSSLRSPFHSSFYSSSPLYYPNPLWELMPNVFHSLHR